jgi:hypothetical protein
MVLVAVMLFYFSRLGVQETFWELLPALLIGGVGISLVMTPSAAAALAGVPVAKSGVGSAVLNSCRQVGGSLGIAVIGAIMANEIGNSRTPEAFVHGFSTALDVAALIALGGAVVAATLVRARPRHAIGDAEAVAESAS